MLHALALVGAIVVCLAIVVVVYMLADAADRAAVWLNKKFIDWYMRWYGSGS